MKNRWFDESYSMFEDRISMSSGQGGINNKTIVKGYQDPFSSKCSL